MLRPEAAGLLRELLGADSTLAFFAWVVEVEAGLDVPGTYSRSSILAVNRSFHSSPASLS